MSHQIVTFFDRNTGFSIEKLLYGNTRFFKTIWHAASIYPVKLPLISKKVVFFICLHSPTFVYTRLHLSRLVNIRLDSSTFVYTRLVTDSILNNRNLYFKFIYLTGLGSN